MLYSEQKPNPALAEHVKCFWSIENDGSGPVKPELVLPDGCPEIVFNFADRFEKVEKSGASESQSSAIISGQLRSQIHIRRTGKVKLFGIRFQPFGAFRFVNMPLDELTDQVVPLDNVFGARGHEFEQRMGEADDFRSRVAVAEQFLSSKSSNPAMPNFLRPVVSSISLSGGQAKVGEHLDGFGISERKMQREFAKWIGLSPKMFSRIVRFQNLIRRMDDAVEPGLLASALEMGYYDQPHMIRDFNEFAGTSPLNYFNETHPLSELFTASD